METEKPKVGVEMAKLTPLGEPPEDEYTPLEDQVTPRDYDEA